MEDMVPGQVSLERRERDVEKGRARLLSVASALEQAGVPYGVVGGNAVAAWVARVDESAARNTQDVEIPLRRADLDVAKVALSAAGFVYRRSSSVDRFLDGPEAKARDVVHVVFAGQMVRAESVLPAPEVEDSEVTPSFRLLRLKALLTMKLTSFRWKDPVHVQDLIAVGLIDATWLEHLPGELAGRLQELLDDPEG